MKHDCSTQTRRLRSLGLNLVQQNMEKKQRSSLENMDRVSNLPDPLRSHIVSFLPLKDASRNKILSKGWKHICSSLTNLDFVQILHRNDLKDIIDQSLILHTGQHIQRFRVSVKIGSNSVDALHLNTWISYALRHNVVEFYLDTYSREEIGMFPYSLFHSSTLVVLTLRNLHLNLPSRVHFPVLKTLKLSFVTFHNEHLTCKLFSDCCPRLLNLKIRYCCPDDFTTLSISSTSLSFLKLEDNTRDADDDALNIKLSTPNLREICVYSAKLPEVSPEALSSLVIASFYLYLLPSTSVCMANLACKTLAGLHNVETLRLKWWFIDLLTRIEDLPVCLPTSCCGLKRLVLQMGSTKSQLQWLNLIIRCYPNLQDLFISFYTPSSEVVDDVPQGLLIVEQYLQSKLLVKNLRTVRVEHFQGSANQLEFVGYLLENANILERMDIHCEDCKGENVESQMRISDILLTFTRVSPHARILIL